MWDSYSKEWYRKNRERRIATIKKRVEEVRALLREYKKSLFCIRCGFPGKEFPEVLEFHHRDEKRMNVSLMPSNGNSWENILLEIKKCDILCANCHRIVTVLRKKMVVVAKSVKAHGCEPCNA